MLNPTQETAKQIDEEVVASNLNEEDHVSPDRSIIGPYTVEIPEPRD